MKTAVVTAIGSFSADIVIKNLKRQGLRVIGCDIYPAEWIANSLQVDAFYQVPYASQEEAYVERLLTIGRMEGAGLLIVLTDAEVDVLNRFRQRLYEAGILLCLPSQWSLELCRDKRKLASFLGELGIGNPIPALSLSEASLDRLSYPAVVKPYNGRSSQGLSYINSKEEMQALLKTRDLENLIVQPFYRGRVVTADVVRQAETGRCAVILRRELLRTLNGAGTSVQIFRNPGLEKECQKAAKALKLNGCVNFEFIEGEDGQYHMLECNPRFSGGVKFSCMAGYDCVTNHLRCFTGEPMEEEREISCMYIARKYEEYMTKQDGEEGDGI